MWYWFDLVWWLCGVHDDQGGLAGAADDYIFFTKNANFPRRGLFRTQTDDVDEQDNKKVG